MVRNKLELVPACVFAGILVLGVILCFRSPPSPPLALKLLSYNKASNGVPCTAILCLTNSSHRRDFFLVNFTKSLADPFVPSGSIEDRASNGSWENAVPKNDSGLFRQTVLKRGEALSFPVQIPTGVTQRKVKVTCGEIIYALPIHSQWIQNLYIRLRSRPPISIECKDILVPQN